MYHDARSHGRKILLKPYYIIHILPHTAKTMLFVQGTIKFDILIYLLSAVGLTLGDSTDNYTHNAPNHITSKFRLGYLPRN